jgi:hypothetical protein
MQGEKRSEKKGEQKDDQKEFVTNSIEIDSCFVGFDEIRPKPPKKCQMSNVSRQSVAK